MRRATSAVAGSSSSAGTRVETLRYSLDVFDDRDNLIDVLSRIADLSVAQAAFEIAVAKHTDKPIFLRQVCRVIRSSDRDR